MPDFPDELEYLWRWWNELAMGRTSSGFGPSHISWVDLDAWRRLTGNDLEPWEVACLMELDSTWLIQQGKKPGPSKPSSKK